MAIKQLGAAPSASTDTATKAYVDAAITDLFPIPFHFPGAASAGVKTPVFISPWSGTILLSRFVAGTAGASTVFRVRKNGAQITGTPSAFTASVQSVNHNVAVAAGDTIQIEVTTAGTASDLSITVVVQTP